MLPADAKTATQTDVITNLSLYQGSDRSSETNPPVNPSEKSEAPVRVGDLASLTHDIGGYVPESGSGDSRSTELARARRFRPMCRRARQPSRPPFGGFSLNPPTVRQSRRMNSIDAEVLEWLDQRGAGFHSTEPFAKAHDYTGHQVTEACERLRDAGQIHANWPGGSLFPEVSRPIR